VRRESHEANALFPGPLILRKTPVQLAFLGADALVFIASGLAFYVVMSRVAGASLLGQYSLVFAWLLVFQSIGSFGIPELMMRELGRFSGERGNYLGAGLVIGLSVSFVVVPVMILIVRLTNYDTELKRAITVAAFSLPAAMLSNVVRSGFISSRRTGLILLTRVVEFLAVVPLSLVLLLQGHRLTTLITVVVAGRSAASLLGLWLLHRQVTPVIWWSGSSFLRALISPAVTFAFGNSLGLIGMHMNTIMLSLLAPVLVVGYFTAGMKLIEGMILVPVLFGQFYMPQIAASLESSRENGIAPFRGPFRLLFAMTIPAGIALLLFPEFIVNVLYGSEFRETVSVLRILAVFYLVYAADAQLSMILRAAGLQDQDVRILAVNPAVNFLVNLALIPSMGGRGVALGLLSGGLCTTALRYRCIAREVGSPEWPGFISPLLLWSVVTGTGILFFGAGLPGWAQLSLYCVLALAMFTKVARGAPPPPGASPAGAGRTSRVR
jgi:O-antigen/teichoic acid export membrane protein